MTTQDYSKMSDVQVRELVARIGWAGIRRQMPGLWKQIQKHRAEARRYVDECIDRN